MAIATDTALNPERQARRRPTRSRRHVSPHKWTLREKLAAGLGLTCGRSRDRGHHPEPLGPRQSIVRVTGHGVHGTTPCDQGFGRASMLIGVSSGPPAPASATIRSGDDIR